MGAVSRDKAMAMDELLKEFLTETNESLDVVDVELVRFEQEPNNAKILDNIFRLVHTIKGTCGFLGLPRLETLAHAAESLMGKFREGMPVTGEAVTLILFTLDRLKEILAYLETLQREGCDTSQVQVHAFVNSVNGTNLKVETYGSGGAHSDCTFDLIMTSYDV